MNIREVSPPAPLPIERMKALEVDAIAHGRANAKRGPHGAISTFPAFCDIRFVDEQWQRIVDCISYGVFAERIGR
jgi:hypothetical protein